MCTMEIKQSEGVREEEGERIAVSNLRRYRLCCCISPSLSSCRWRGLSHSDLFGLRKAGSRQTVADDGVIEG